MIINKPWLVDKLEVWAPKWSGKFTKYGEKVALVHKEKVDRGTPILIIYFTKAPSLLGQRFAIKKSYAQQHDVGDNGSAPMYIIPMSHFDTYDTGAEITKIANELFPE